MKWKLCYLKFHEDENAYEMIPMTLEDQEDTYFESEEDALKSAMRLEFDVLTLMMKNLDDPHPYMTMDHKGIHMLCPRGLKPISQYIGYKHGVNNTISGMLFVTATVEE